MKIQSSPLSIVLASTRLVSVGAPVTPLLNVTLNVTCTLEEKKAKPPSISHDIVPGRTGCTGHNLFSFLKQLMMARLFLATFCKPKAVFTFQRTFIWTILSARRC